MFGLANHSAFCCGGLRIPCCHLLQHWWLSSLLSSLSQIGLSYVISIAYLMFDRVDVQLIAIPIWCIIGTTCNVRYQTKLQRTSLQIKFSSKKRFYVSHIWCFLCKNVVWLMFYWAFCKNLLVFWIIPLPINVLWNEYMQYISFLSDLTDYCLPL